MGVAENMNAVIAVIRQLNKEGVKVTAPALVEITGLSFLRVAEAVNACVAEGLVRKTPGRFAGDVIYEVTSHA